VPGGMYGADENCRPGFYAPCQAAETCAVADMMHSDEILFGITGDIKWADRCENVAFNTLPATMTPDLKALHYLTAPNVIQCDISNKAPRLQDNLEMLIFDPHRYRCCQHNVSHAWPFYAANLWMATPGNGLAVVLYAPSKVNAKVRLSKKRTIHSTKISSWHFLRRSPFAFRCILECQAGATNPKLKSTVNRCR